MIFGAKVKEARELRGLTQGQLAELVGIDRSTVAYVESGRIQPRSEVLASIAEGTGFPESFFQDDDDIEFPAGSLLFRSRKDMRVREEVEARAWGSMVYRRVDKLRRRLTLPPVTIPRLSLDPEQAAVHARASLGLSPDRPIAHLINSIERAGVLVLALPVALERRDAFSAWVGEDELRPVIVVLDGVPGDRLRFSVAHELGHLVLHQARPTRIPEIEAQANEFAAELLMPREGISTDLVPPVTLTGLAPLKLKWGVSIQAIVMRARTLGIITDRQYYYLFQQIGRRHWRVREPANLDVPIERPRAVRKMVEIIYGESPDYLRIAEDMRLFPHQARQLVESHASRAQLPRAGSVGGPRLVQFPKPILTHDK